MKFNLTSNRFEDLTAEPKKIAISGSNIDITWQQLYDKVNHLDLLIKELAIPAGHPVIIYGHKETEFIVSIVALMMNDIPYVPVDKLMPIERVHKLQQITQSQIIINLTDNIVEAFNFSIVIQNTKSIERKNKPEYNKGIYWRKNDPIRYIIFTSGSTGEPKGVQITHEAVKSFADWMEKDFGLIAEDVYMNQAPFSFDLSVYELYCFLDRGSSIVLNTAEQSKNPDIFIERVKKYNCSVWVSTPTFAYLYLSDPRFNSEYFPSLKTFLFCGESLPKKTAKMLLERFPNSRVLNTYGPTEATVATTLIDVTHGVLEKYKDMPIGYPKYSSEIIIDNESHNPLEPGEIIIVGDNVSIGYFNNPELNKQKYFLHNSKRAFRTGDYGYFLDNILFFSGRKDEQVKLHGYRIELGDINTQISKHPKVKDAVTVPLKAGDTVKKLVTFVQLQSVENIDEATLKIDIIEAIKKVLPEYMIPGDIVVIKEFPVNNNLKIDKNKLIELYTS